MNSVRELDPLKKSSSKNEKGKRAEEYIKVFDRPENFVQHIPSSIQKLPSA